MQKGRDLPKPSTVGGSLKFWRAQRGASQLSLALSAGVSQRHLSFVESGRSAPSRTMLTTLADALNIPFRDRNTMFLQAGFAPVYAEPALDSAAMAVVTHAIDEMLHRHEPNPALLMDQYWNVLRPNLAAKDLFGSMIDLASIPEPRNLLMLTFDPAGLRPFVENWESVAAGLLRRVQREALGGVVDAKLGALLEALTHFPGVGTLPVLSVQDSPVLPITFRMGAKRLSYFSLVTSVGAPQSVTAQELRLECMFPMPSA